MKKEISIPSYKEAGSTRLNGKTYSIFTIAILATIIVFAGVSLGGITGLSSLGGVTPAKSTYYSTNWQTNRGNNAITVIEINPDKVIAGGIIQVTVDPGNKGVWKEMKLEYWGSNADSEKECGKGVLKDSNVKEFASSRPDSPERGGFDVFDVRTFGYTTSASWSEGRYAIRAYDYQANAWICQPFIVYRFNSRSEDIKSFDASKSILNQLGGV